MLLTRVAAVFALALLAGTAVAASRVVALSPHLAELACAAGGCDRLVGAVAYSDYPSRVAKLPHVGDAFQVNLERLLALQPDLVLAWDGGTPPATVERIRALHLNVEWIAVRRLDDIAEAIERIGGLLGTPAAARAAAQSFRARLVALRARYAGARRLTALYQIGLEPIYTVNRASPISEALALCGADNVFASLPQIAAPVGVESVIKADPDVILFGRDEDLERIKAFWSRFPDLSAVKHERLYAVNATLLARPTPRMLDGIEQLCETLRAAR